MLRVVKFGGSSVGNADAFKAVGGILKHFKRRGENVVAVFSAMMSVTNRLIKSSDAASRGDMKQVAQIKDFLFELHRRTVIGLNLEPATRSDILGWLDTSMKDDFVGACEKVAQLGVCTGEKSDFISSLGERWSTAIMAQYLEDNNVASEYVLASDVLITDGMAGGATPDLELTKPLMLERLVPLLQNGVLPCVTGFIGADRYGTVTTLGRGGSDLSASVVGNVLDADEVTMYKVESTTAEDGTLAAWKPGWIGIIPKGSEPTETIPFMSYEEATHLKKVLHPATCYPLMEKEIPIRVGNTLEYLHPGTLISNRGESSTQGIRPWPLIVTPPPAYATQTVARTMRQRAFSTIPDKYKLLPDKDSKSSKKALAEDAIRVPPSPCIVPHINPDLIKPQDNGT
jgi:aspartate kinase